jgi:NAD(P)-dependent dehydrogenase (short-subunit alcohol dehydrogenase family)
MERALIIGASGGIGRALAEALADRLGAAGVTGLSRSGDGLDVTDEASVAAQLGALDGPFDTVLVASGVLAPAGQGPEKALAGLSADTMARVLAINAIGPALVLKHALRLLPRDRRAVVGVLSARVGSIGDNGLGGWYSYRASKAAVNQIVHTAAIEIGRSHRHAVCVALHPGTVATPFTADYRGRHPAVAAAESAANLLAVLDGLTPAETGGFFDWAGNPVPW